MTKEERKRHNKQTLSYYGLGPMTPEEEEVVSAISKFEQIVEEILERGNHDD